MTNLLTLLVSLPTPILFGGIIGCFILLCVTLVLVAYVPGADKRIARFITMLRGERYDTATIRHARARGKRTHRRRKGDGSHNL